MSCPGKWYVLLWMSITLIAAGCGAPATISPEPKPSPLPGTAWRPQRSTDDKVHDLAVDGEWLWVAASQGLVRLNQRTLTYEMFPHLNSVYTLLVDDQGRLWVGGRHGLVRYDDDGSWTVIYAGKMTTTFGLDADGNLWRFTLYSRVPPAAYRFQGQEPPASGDWEPKDINVEWTSVEWQSFWSNCANWRFKVSDTVKYSSPAGCAAAHSCARLPPLELPVERGIRASPPHSRLIAEDADGEYWFVSLSSYYHPYQFLIHYDGESVQAIPWLYGSVYATVAAGMKRGVWIGSEEGLFYSDGQTIEQYLFDSQRLVPLKVSHKSKSHPQTDESLAIW